MNIKEKLEDICSMLTTECITGGGAGSILKIKLEDSSYFFIYCVWRIEHYDIVLSTSDDSVDAIIGRMAKSAKLLENKRVLSVEMSKQYDLIIYFEDSYCLKVFCNVSYSRTENGGTYDTNWELCLPNKDIVFIINNYFKVETDAYY